MDGWMDTHMNNFLYHLPPIPDLENVWYLT